MKTFIQEMNDEGADMGVDEMIVFSPFFDIQLCNNVKQSSIHHHSVYQCP